MDKIQQARDHESLMEACEFLAKKGLRDYKIDHWPFDAQEFATFSLEEQQKLLMSMLDKNWLYVPLSEIDDADFEFTAHEKELNHAFYHLSDSRESR